MMVVEERTAREGYKMTELGEIPVEWEVVRIGEVLTESKECNQPNYPLLSITRHRGIIRQDETIKRDVSAKDKSKYKVLRPNRLVYNTMRMWQGVSAVSETTGIISPAYTVCNIDLEKVNPKFLEKLFKLPFMVNLFHRFSQGLVDDTLSIKYEAFSKLNMILPPLYEQQKIAEILSEVDKQIENTEQLIEKTKELKKGLMQQLLTKGIGHTEFKSTEIGEIPVGWEVIKLSDISGFITKGSTPTTYGYEWQNTGIPFFKSDVVKEGQFVFGDYKFISEEAHLQMSRSVIRSGDILISITGNIGRVAIVPKQIKEGNINQHIAKITIESSLSTPLFVYYWLNQEKIENYYKSIKTGLAYPQISLKQVRETIIPLPSIEEQHKITEILSSVDEQINWYQQEKAKHLELNRGLTQQLLTGKIRVQA